MKTTVLNAARILAILCAILAPVSAQQATTPPAAPPRQMIGYIIGPNDLLRIAVFSGGNSQEEFRRFEYTVQPDGSIALPYLRPLVIGGKSQSDAAALIKKSLIDTKVYGDDCNVDVTVMEYRSSNLTVQGAVRNPGKISMTADRMNINDAIAKANGLQPTAGSEIRVKRAGGRPSPPEAQVKDGWEIYSRRELDNGTLIDIQLFDNDTIDVPVAPRFFVTGFVNTVGDFQWEPNLTLERALFKAGGAKTDGALNRIEVRRLNPKTKVVEAVKLKGNDREKMAFIIEPNDVIDVPKKRM